MRLRDFGAAGQRFAGIIGLRRNKLLFSVPDPSYAQEGENGARALPLWGIGGMCAPAKRGRTPPSDTVKPRPAVR